MLFVALCMASLHCFGQCNYYYLQNNKIITMGTYDRKGNPTGKCVYKISGMTKAGATTTANVQSEVFDKKEKIIGGGKGTMQCRDGRLMMDMQMTMNPQQMQQMKEVKVGGKGAYLEYPVSLKEGQTLDDANFDMDMKMESGMEGRISLNITNRIVQGKENVTTPAGSWEAYKITYNSKTIMYMGIAMPINIQMTEWFVPDFGVIKSESKWGKTEIVSIQ